MVASIILFIRERGENIMMQKITITDPYGNLRTVECGDITKEEYDSHPGPEYTTTVIWNPRYQSQLKGGDTMYKMCGQIIDTARDNATKEKGNKFKQNIAQPVKPNKSKDNSKNFVITYSDGTKIYVTEDMAPKLSSTGTGVTVHNVFGNYIQPRKSQSKKIQPKGRGGHFSNLVSIHVDSDKQKRQNKNQQSNQQSLVGNNSCKCNEVCKCHNHEHHHNETVKNNNVGGIDLSTIKVAVTPDGLFAHLDSKDNTFKLLNQHELDVHYKYGVEFIDLVRTPDQFKQMAKEEHYSCIDPRLKQPGELWKKR